VLWPDKRESDNRRLGNGGLVLSAREWKAHWTSRARGRPRKVSDADVERVLTTTLESVPRDATHWSTRSLAQQSGLSRSTISRIGRAFGWQSHRSETCKLSKDPLFIDKVRDIVGLYLNPPDRALVLCVDEKSQMQALDRTQPLFAHAARPDRTPQPR